MGNCCKALGCAGRPCHITWPTSTAGGGVPVEVGVAVTVRVGVEVGVMLGVKVEDAVGVGVLVNAWPGQIGTEPVADVTAAGDGLHAAPVTVNVTVLSLV